MATTRVWQSGAETGSIDEVDGVDSSAMSTPDVSSTQAKTGTYSIYTNVTTSNGWTYAYVTIPATRQIEFGCFHYGNAPTNGTREMWSMRSAAGNLIMLQLTSANVLELVVGVGTEDTSSAFGSLAWKRLSLDIKIHATTGWVKVYRDNVEILSFEGNTGNADIVQMRFGALEWGSNEAMPHYWDDMFINDTTGETMGEVIPNLRFYFITPNGNGNYADWDGSDGNQVDNYLLVDEVPPSDADYVETNVVDELDSYTMTTFVLSTDQLIKAIIPIARANREGATEQIALGTRYSGTDLIGSDQNPSGSFDYVWERQVTKPGGGDWDQASLDGVEAVIKSRGTF